MYTKQNDRFGIISSNGSLQPVSELPELEKPFTSFVSSTFKKACVTQSAEKFPLCDVTEGTGTPQTDLKLLLVFFFFQKPSMGISVSKSISFSRKLNLFCFVLFFAGRAECATF